MVEIGIIMGSKSDLPIMKEAVEILDTLGITSEVDIVSAHRTPEKMMSYGIQAHTRGIKVIIAWSRTWNYSSRTCRKGYS